MHKLDLVKEIFDNLYNLLKEINLLGSDLLYLHGEDGSKIHPNLVPSPLLSRFQESHKIKFTLDLCNYLEYKGDHSIIKLLNRLASQYNESEWKYLITQQNIRVILNNTNEIKNL